MKLLRYIIPLVLLNSGLLPAQKVLTLEESKQLALEHNAEMANSRLEVEAAEQVKKAAFTKYFPQVSATAMMMAADKPLMEMKMDGGNLPVYDGNPANLATATQFAYFPGVELGLLEDATVAAATAVQPVFAGGRIFNGNRLATVGVQAKKMQQHLTREEVLLQTEQNYWQIVSLQDKHKTILRYEELLQKLAEQVEDAYKAGLVMKNDVLKVRLKQSEVRLNKSQLENGLELARMAFCQQIGILYEAHLELSDRLVVNEAPQALYTNHEAALQNRDEHKLLQLGVRASALQTDLKWGEILPQAGIGYMQQYLELDKAGGRNIGILFGTVSVPLSDWWGGAHEIQEKKIEEKIARNTLRDKSRLLSLQMEKARRDLDDAWKQYQLSIDNQEQARENLKVNQSSYENGLSNTSDLLEAQAMLQQAEDQLTDAQAGYVLGRRRYLQVTGRGE